MIEMASDELESNPSMLNCYASINCKSLQIEFKAIE
jgi:hypothetical protein